MDRVLTGNFRSPAALARFLLTAAIGVALDLWTKHVAFARLAPAGLEIINGRVRVRMTDETVQEYAFIHRWVHFRAMVNQGAVFGFGQGWRLFFIFVSIAAVAFIVYLFAASGRRQRFYQFILGLLLAGVIGNLYDRARFGYVRDMIWIFPRRLLFNTGREVFPWIFNVADSLLCVGVFLIFVYSFRGLLRPDAPARPRD